MSLTGTQPTQLADVRPRLRNDVVFLRVDTGIYLRSSEVSCVLKGRGVYDWMAALGPRMTGEWTVADLCAGLDDNRRRTAEGLLRTLLDRGFARDATTSGDAGLPNRCWRGSRPRSTSSSTSCTVTTGRRSSCSAGSVPRGCW